MELLTYQTVLAIHIISFVWNIGWVVLSDFSGLLWITGKVKVLNAKFMKIAHYAVWAGLASSILSGAYLFIDLADYLLTVPAFYTKMFLVLALVINSFVISKHLHVATTGTFVEVSKEERLKLFISGAVSTVSWVGVVVSAHFLGL